MNQQQAKAKAKERDNHTCQFCGMENGPHKTEYGHGLHAHHLIKQSDDGPDTPENLITVCKRCHDVLERTQARALSVIRDGFTHDEDHEELLQQRDALIDRVHLLERAIRTPEFYARVLDSIPARGEVVTETYGHRVVATSNSDKAHEAYEEWGSSIQRSTFYADKDDIAEAYPGLSSELLNHIVTQLPRKTAERVADEMR